MFVERDINACYIDDVNAAQISHVGAEHINGEDA